MQHISPSLCHFECHHKKNTPLSKPKGMLKGDEHGFNTAQLPSTVYSGNYKAKSCKKVLSLFVSCYAFSQLQLDARAWM